MTHEAGIEAACNKAASYGVHRPSAQCMSDSIQAYLNASGMTLIPIESASLALNSLRCAQVIMGEGGSHDRVAAIKALETTVSKS